MHAGIVAVVRSFGVITPFRPNDRYFLNRVGRASLWFANAGPLGVARKGPVWIAHKGGARIEEQTFTFHFRPLKSNAREKIQPIGQQPRFSLHVRSGGGLFGEL